TFSNGKTAPHHTAIVAAVDGKGRPTAIYEQNGVPSKRHVVKESLDFGSLTGGWGRVYRPSKPKSDPPAPFEFTLLNRTDRPVTFTVGRRRESLDAYDSERGFNTYRYSGSAVLVVGRSTLRPAHRKGYELYRMKDGKIAMREVK